MLTKNSCRERVERTQVNAVAAPAQELIDPLAHYGGGETVKCECQNRCVLVLFDYSGNAKRQYRRLARARAREHKQRPVTPRYGLTLVLIE